MNADENEKYNLEDSYFQDDETRYQDDGLDTPLPNQIKNNSEGNYDDHLKDQNIANNSENKKLEDNEFGTLENDNEEDDLSIDRPL